MSALWCSGYHYLAGLNPACGVSEDPASDDENQQNWSWLEIRLPAFRQ